MKTINLSYYEYQKIVQNASDSGLDIQEYIGALNDDYLIHSCKSFGLKGHRKTEYILLFAKYKNPWTNTFHAILTNSHKKADSFIYYHENVQS